MSGFAVRQIELLRDTADPLEALARRLMVELVGSGGWHPSRCDDLMTDRCKCMVSAERPGLSPFDTELYIASAQTPDLARYLSLFSPQEFALQLVFLMRATAREVSHLGDLAYPQTRLRDKRITGVLEMARTVQRGLHG